ncbi:hypothetical protein FOA43_000280 [Brettanomyces nanus]|uniref:Uncharacterized protein n=1 Tax=Eeniella nana TaxID=13502 RepID=A0A875RW50_EENNA|nr:uncharacterized protein FOA43_000280 [Brettanomyces nanus]QPG72976.1 hypothetical protein FOA43_000280 [Brettanomyces nanus]
MVTDKSSAQNDQQHKKLRQRLEDELSFRNSELEAADYDWFVRSSGSSIAPLNSLKPPGVTDGASQKAAPSVSANRSNATSLSVGLKRSKTNDLGSLPSTEDHKEHTDPAALSKLTRTATNVTLSDVSTPTGHSGILGTSTGTGRPRSRSTNPDIGYPFPLSEDSHPTQHRKEAKGSFFKRLFGKKEETKHFSSSRKPSLVISPTSAITPISIPSTEKRASISSVPSKLSPSSSATITGSGAASEDMASDSSVLSIQGRKIASNSESSSTIQSADSSAAPSSTSETLSDQYKDIDPLLARYLRDIEAASNDSSLHKCISSDLSRIFRPGAHFHLNYKGGVIPPHPDQPKLSSAFSMNPRFGGSIELELFEKSKRERAQSKESAGVFGSLLRRQKSNPTENALMRVMCNESEASPPLNFKHVPYVKPPPKVELKPPMEPLRDVKPLKKVAFATTTFVNDPPQQIPSRHPRKGNVEIGPSGELIIHKITAEDKAHSTCGIVVGGSGHLKLMSEMNPENNPDNENREVADKISDSESSTSTSPAAPVMSRTPSDHTIREEDKILAAEKALQNAGAHADENTEGNLRKDKIMIDTPMVRRRRQMEKPVVTLKIDELYTRCCHLREILPIPATLKQIPKGSTDPIPVLRLRNPKPSMIEILSFTDFIRIAPIICLSLDGVSLTHEMFRLILSSLLYKRYLEKLSLRNTPIDGDGWKMLCWFVSMNKALKRLDITQCPALSVNTQKVHKHKKKPNVAELPRMICNMEDRGDMDWPLLTASIIYRGGIGEMILSGCKIRDNRMFRSLLHLGLSHTRKLGLAYNDLNLSQCEIVAQWMHENKDCTGIDLGYNDMSNNLRPFIDYAQSARLHDQLWMLSLNSCNLIDSPEAEQMFNSFSKLQHLKYLDISNNSKFFRTFVNKLFAYLPLFSELVRLNFDDNGLDSMSMIKLCECLPLMAHLNYISIRGNNMDESVCIALCRSLQSSTSIFTLDFDRDSVPERFQRRFGLLTMKNMERTLYDDNKDNKSTFLGILGETEADDIRKSLNIPDGVSFGEALIDVIKKGDSLPPGEVGKYVSVAARLRVKMKEMISELMKLHVIGKLSIEGKELLIRLINFDSSISKGIELTDSVHFGKKKSADTSSMAAKELFDRMFENERTLPSSSPGARENEAIEIKSDDTDLPTSMSPEAVEASSAMISAEARAFKAHADNGTLGFKDKVKSAVSAYYGALSPENKEKYKRVMMHTHDAFEVVRLLNGLKAKGVCLSDLYRKRPDNTVVNTKANARKSGMTVVENKNAASGEETDEAKEEEDGAFGDGLSDMMNADESFEHHDDMMVLYDKVLKDLVDEANKRRQGNAEKTALAATNSD